MAIRPYTTARMIAHTITIRPYMTAHTIAMHLRGWMIGVVLWERAMIVLPGCVIYSPGRMIVL
jgi:hypothetical protein